VLGCVVLSCVVVCCGVPWCVVVCCGVLWWCVMWCVMVWCVVVVVRCGVECCSSVWCGVLCLGVLCCVGSGVLWCGVSVFFSSNTHSKINETGLNNAMSGPSGFPPL